LQTQTVVLKFKATCVLYNWLRETYAARLDITGGVVDIEVWVEGRRIPGNSQQDVSTAEGVIKAAFIHNNKKMMQVLCVFCRQNTSVPQKWFHGSGK
jgi:hypothetical protein